jgi:phytoene dehydrogenase-like protein
LCFFDLLGRALRIFLNKGALMKYDVIVIGSGLSGLAAGIRLAMFDKKVLTIDKHTVVGGLNSFYTRKHRTIDVGLHAMLSGIKRIKSTNYCVFINRENLLVEHGKPYARCQAG